jgi:hypothetical protein
MLQPGAETMVEGVLEIFSFLNKFGIMDFGLESYIHIYIIIVCSSNTKAVFIV